MNLTEPISQPVKILVVDDHPNTAALLARAISQLGQGVVVASATSGRQALDSLQDSPVDILITDMDMPEMTGLELIEKLHQRSAGGPTFSYLLTASQVSGLKIEARRLNFTEVLRKPTPPQHICQIIRHALREMDLVTRYKELAAQREFKILIVNDDPDSVTLLSRYLEGEGYAYVIASDGLEAFEQIRDEQPDLVLLDINLSYQAGFTILQELRTDFATQSLPVIILRPAWSSDVESAPGLHVDGDDYITKPIDRRQLLTRIRKKLLMKEVKRTGIT